MNTTELRDSKINELTNRYNFTDTAVRIALEEAWEHGNKIGNQQGADYTTATVRKLLDSLQKANSSH